MTGGDPIRTVPPAGRFACRMARFPCLTRTCSHTNSKYRPAKGISSRHDGRLCRLLPARCAIMPARSGSGGSRARPFWGDKVGFDGFPDGVQPGPARWLTEAQSLTIASIVSRRAGRLPMRRFAHVESFNLASLCIIVRRAIT